MRRAAITPAAGPDSAVRTGKPPRGRGRHDAAVGLHDLQLAGEALRRQRCFELAEIGADDRLQIGVERGRSRSARTRGSRAASRCEAVTCAFGQTCAQPRARRLLVVGVGVGVDEEDGQRLRALVAASVARGCAHLRRDRPACGCVPSASMRSSTSRRRSRSAIGTKSPHRPQVRRPVAAAHLQHVAKAARGDDADARALALQQRVGADRGAVHDRADAGRRRPARSRPFMKPRASSPRCDGTLAVRNVRVCFVEQEQVGEGAADVDADDQPCRSCPARAHAVASASSDRRR